MTIAAMDVNNMQDFTGLLEDDRPESLKERDWQYEELYGSVPTLIWEEREPKKYDKRYQALSNSCVGQSFAKAGTINFGKILSATPIYQNRKNKPAHGMYLYNAADIMKKIGTTSESILKSQGMSDQEMDSAEIPEQLPYKLEGYGYADFRDIDQLADMIQKNGSVVLTFTSNREEWTEIPEYKGNETTFGHAVTGVDFILKGGKKYIVIEDSTLASTTINNSGQRLISQDFFNKRCTMALYPIFGKEKPVVKPEPFKTIMKFGQKSKEIARLQDFLKVEGLFPTGTNSTGYYGSATQRAVLKFQQKYAVASEAELARNQGKQVGLKTLAKINEVLTK